MKALILILSSNNSFYPELRQVQRETFVNDCKSTDWCHALFYTSKHLATDYNSDTIYTTCEDTYMLMHAKFKECLNIIGNALSEFDYIIRINASTYIDINQLKIRLQDLPKEKYYSGYSGGNFASGACFIISSDVAMILAKDIDVQSDLVEDVEIGRVLMNAGIELVHDDSRCSIYEQDYHVTYNYRCKGENRPDDDIEAMRLLHKALKR